VDDDGAGGPRRRRGGHPSSARIAPVVAICALLAACGGGSGSASRADPGSAADGAATTLRVFAAASLTDAMADLEEAFEVDNPSVDVVVDLAGSASLRAQILEGAPADVVATANVEIMDDLVAAGVVTGRPVRFATNRLVLVVAPGNPAGVEALDDLTDASLFVGLCAAEVPCGDLADAALGAAGLVVEPDTREPDVRSLLAKVRSGELDAGLVYATDASAAADAGVEAIELPAGLPVTTDYPAAVLTTAAEPRLAAAFTTFLVDGPGREILAANGFGRP
jgi:molybdate transport system substrate-binding protein